MHCKTWNFVLAFVFSTHLSGPAESQANDGATDSAVDQTEAVGKGEYSIPIAETSLKPFDAGAEPFSMCYGKVQDIKHVKDYVEESGITSNVVTETSKATFQVRWESYAEITLGGFLTQRRGQGGVAEETWCTASILENQYQTNPDAIRFISAAHCFQPERGNWGYPKRPDGSKINAFEIATLMIVKGWFQKRNNPSRVPPEFDASITRLVEYGFDGPRKLDYAIFEVARADIPTDLHDSGPTIRTDRPSKGESIAIVQHPNGLRKRVDADQLSGRISSPNGNLLFYDNLNTYFRSSGSAVVDRDGKLLAVHIQGADRGYECAPGSGSAQKSNKALSIRSIMEASGVL